jgi:hypothetical protein
MARRCRIIDVATKLMTIRQPDTCTACAVPLPCRTQAWCDSTAPSVICTNCRPVDQQIEDRWGTGRISEVATFLTDAPQTNTERAKGAGGERRVAEQLDCDLDGVATVLHDRKVPLSRADIDHLVVAPTGIWIIDAKHCAGKVERRDVEGRRTTGDRLYVDNRDQTELVSGMGWQADAVQLAIEPIGFGAAPIRRCLCFTNAEWGVSSTPFVIDDVWIGWGKALVEAIQTTPVLNPAAVITLSHHLNTWFPASN